MWEIKSATGKVHKNGRRFLLKMRIKPHVLCQKCRVVMPKRNVKLIQNVLSSRKNNQLSKNRRIYRRFFLLIWWHYSILKSQFQLSIKIYRYAVFTFAFLLCVCYNVNVKGEVFCVTNKTGNPQTGSPRNPTRRERNFIYYGKKSCYYRCR